MPKLIPGKNAILSALRAEEPILRILMSKTLQHDSKLDEIIFYARQQRVPIMNSDKQELDRVAKDVAHQGIVAFAPAQKFVDPQDIIEYAQSLDEMPFMVMLDSFGQKQLEG